MELTLGWSLDVWRQTLDSKRFKLSRFKTKYLECKFNDATHEVGMEVRLDTKPSPKKKKFQVHWVLNLMTLRDRQ